MRDNFEYCRICGTELEGGVPGDYSTDMLNVFTHGDGYMYLFSEKGHQVVLKADSLDELACKVKEAKYPWEFRKFKDNKKPRNDETSQMSDSDFLKPSRLNGFDEIPSASPSHPESEVEPVENKSDDESEFQSGKDYVENIEDVSFGKIWDRNITGCVPTLWGPDNSERAVKLRQNMFR